MDARAVRFAGCRRLVVLRAVLRVFAAVAGFAALLREVELLFLAVPLLFLALVRALFFAGAAVVFLAAVLVRLLAVRRFEVDFRFGRAVVRLLEPVVLDDRVSSIGHLPDMTRCAASATASAINAPNFVALDMTDFAALSAVSAASIPASLIALRAFGLALIAAAAAASPAASISLLIAALASLSAVELLVREDDFEVDLRLLDFAIADLRSDSPIRQMNQTTVPLRERKGKGNPQVQMCQRGPLSGSDPLEHGQRPEVTAVRSAPTADEHPFPTSLLNHETSDHLLSLR